MPRSGEQGVLSGFVYQKDEPDQGLVPAPQLCFHETGQDDQSRSQTYQSDGISHATSNWVTQEQVYYNREVRGQWSYENIIHHEGHDHEYSQQIQFLMADQTRVRYGNSTIPNSVDCTGGVGGQYGNYGYQDYCVQPIKLQASDYPENPSYGRPGYMEQGIANSDYENQTQNNLRQIFNPERLENPYIYTENDDSAIDLSLHHEHRANQFGTSSITDSDIEVLDWRLGAQYWNSLDIPLDMSMHRPVMDQFVSGESVLPENQIQYASSFGNLPRSSTGSANNTDSNMETIDWRAVAQDWNSLDIPLDMSMDRQTMDRGHSEVEESQKQCASSLDNLPGPSGTTVNLRTSSQTNSTGTKTLKTRRKRKSPEDPPVEPPKTKSEQLLQIRESELLASYRPILPKPTEIKSSKQRKAEDDRQNELQEIRKKWRGWKCCSETFDDYNLYQNHVQSDHGRMEAPPPTTRKKKSASKPTTTEKKAPSSAPSTTSKSKAIMCPFCLTNHEILGPDITTKPRWNGSDYLMCPLCHRWYKTLRQLKVHFCLHFQVKVNENKKPVCRYCNKVFMLVANLRKHEAICMTGHAAKKNCTVDKQPTEAEVVASTSSPSASTTAAAADATVSTADATVSTADATVSTAATRVSPTAKRVSTTATKVSPTTKRVSTTATRPSTTAATVPTAETPATAAAGISMAVSSKLAASPIASAAMATEATAAAAVSAAETPSPAAATTPKSRDDRLFYCPDCGKLFTWAGSVRRHQNTSHPNSERKSQGTNRRKGVGHHQPENQTQRQPQQQQQHCSATYAPVNRVTSHDEDFFAVLQIDDD